MTISHTLIAVLPLLVVSLILVSVVKSTMINQVEDNNKKLVSITNKNINMKLAELESTSMVIMSDDSLVKILSKSKEDYDNLFDMLKERETLINEKLFSIQYSNNNIKNIMIIKEDETIECRTTNGKISEGFYESDIYEKVTNSKGRVVWFSNVYDNPDSIYLMRKLTRISTAHEVGILVIEVKKSYITDAFNNEENTTDETLVDSNGIVIYNSDAEKVGQLFDGFEEIKNDIGEDNEAEVITGNLNMDNKMTSYIQSENEWYFIEQIPNEVFLGAVNNTKKLVLIICLIISVIAIVISNIISINISYPIKYIRNKMKLVEDGDLTAVSHIKGKHEMGQLSNSYNTMLASTKKLINDNRELIKVVSDNSNQVAEISRHSAAGSKEVTMAVGISITRCNGTRQKMQRLQLI